LTGSATPAKRHTNGTQKADKSGIPWGRRLWYSGSGSKYLALSYQSGLTALVRSCPEFTIQ
jgi:hypothetical protein